jgi:hypothetical protein
VGLTDDALALAFRTGLPYVGLRDHAHDPDLDRLIPPDAASVARAIPLAADDEHVRLAVADPDADLSTLAPYLTEREVELALAPREEIDAILGPPPAAGHEWAAAATGERWAGAEEEGAVAAGAERHAADRPEAGAEAEGAAAAEDEPGAADEPWTADEEAGVAGAPPGDELERGSLGAAADTREEPAPATEVEPESLAAEPEAAPATASSEQEPVASDAATGGPEPAASPPASPDNVDEVAPDEVPSWLEPPSRKRRVLVTALFIVVLLIAAAVLVIALINA